MFCQLTRTNLLSYHEGSLTGWRRQLVARHVAGCQRCSRELRHLAATDQALRQLAQQAHVAMLPTESSLGYLDSLDGEEQRRKQAHLPGFSSGLRGRFAARLAAAAVVITLLFSLAPQLAPLAADMPLVGPLVRQAILKDAGLRWAYDSGYVLQEPVRAQVGRYELTVVGYVADPIQTAVIVLVNGPDEELTRDRVHPEAEVPDSLVWVGMPERTALGNLYLIGSSPLPSAGAEVQVRLRIEGERVEPGLDLFITPDPIARVSTEKMLSLSVKQQGYRWEAERMVETPAQRMYELIHSRDLQITQAPILVTDQGEHAATNWGTAYGTADGEWRRPVVFDRGPGQPMELRLAGLLRWQRLDLPLVIPLGNEQQFSVEAGPHSITVQVLRWPGSDAPTASQSEVFLPPGFDLSISVQAMGYEGYPNADLIDWQLRTSSGETLRLQDLMEHGIGFSPSEDNEQLLHLRIPGGATIQSFEVTRVAAPSDPVVFDLR